MSRRRSPPISTRKEPQQARSHHLVAAVLKAAVQVLAKEGGQRFTMARVAAKAGVSVGSLYQYFPNKAAVLFRLQSDEWRQTSDLLRGVLEDTRRPPLERLRTLVRAFVQSECDEAAVRVALSDVAPLYRDAPEAHAARAEGEAAVEAFLREALPRVSERVRTLAADLLTTTLSAVGKQVSESARTAPEIEAYADALADMLCAYLESLSIRKPRSRMQGRTPTIAPARVVSTRSSPSRGMVQRGDAQRAPDRNGSFGHGSRLRRRLR